MKKVSLIVLLVCVCAAFANFFVKGAKAQITETETQNETKKKIKFTELIEAARQTGAMRVIVGLRSEFKSEGKLNLSEKQQQRQRIKLNQDTFFNKHQSLRLEKSKQFKTIPFVAFETDAASLEQMKSDPQITSIEEDTLDAPSLAESTALVGAPVAWESGFSGAGQTIAVIDSGVDKNHPFLSGKVVSEGCYSSTYGNATSLCPNGVNESVAPDSSLNCPTTLSGCGHGTHVAGIAAGRGANMSGVAKDANIISIQVFSKIEGGENPCGSSPSPCIRTYVSDQIKALERVLVLSSTMNIAAVNMSLGGGQYSSVCDANQVARKTAIDNLRSVGVATVVASGNDSYTGAMNAPACISSSVSVGSVDDGGSGLTSDAISGFSNASSNLNLLAPGRWINSSTPDGRYSNYSGTSMAAPHVAGAFAVLKQRSPNASVSKILSALTSSGQYINDSRNGLSKPRIKIADALRALDKKPAFDYDGDGKADMAIFRPTNNVWYIQTSSNNSFDVKQFGSFGDLVAPADFDGDGKTDVSVFRPSTGVWHRLDSSSGNFSSTGFGTNGDLPVPADYDGDGKADLAVFRPSTGSWWISQSSNGATISQNFGLAEDVPTIGDFDGDGKSDIGVWRPSNGAWYRINSSNGTLFVQGFGLAGDKPVPADFDGDGKTDVSIFRPSDGKWYRINSSSNSMEVNSFGLLEDSPAAADFDGDGKADLAVFRPSIGIWYILRSTQGFFGNQFGLTGDIPAQSAFVR
ncbi:MAG TPA: S8 family serine peptidase [Pyrinomonadaceae bacterium]|jgi:subtilisin family serine protease